MGGVGYCGEAGLPGVRVTIIAPRTWWPLFLTVSPQPRLPKMPRVKWRKEDKKENRPCHAMRRLANDSFKSIREADIAFNAPCPHLFTVPPPTKHDVKHIETSNYLAQQEERGIVNGVLHQSDLGFPPRLDIVHQYLDSLALPNRC